MFVLPGAAPCSTRSRAAHTHWIALLLIACRALLDGRRRYESYEDAILLRNEQGFFVVPILAKLSKLAVSVPKALDFNFCPVNETTERTFMVKNVGQIDADIRWEMPGPFELVPRTRNIAPGEELSITAKFSPKDASVFVVRAVCYITDGDPDDGESF